MRKVIMVASAIMMLNLGGCATATRGTTQSWTIQTTPPNAKAVTTNGFTCDATPCTFTISRKAEFDVDVSLNGYKPFHGSVTHHMSGAGGAGLAGNVLVGGLIGMGVDASSGALLDLAPNPMNVTLAPVDSTGESTLTPEGDAKPADKPVS